MIIILRAIVMMSLFYTSIQLMFKFLRKANITIEKLCKRLNCSHINGYVLFVFDGIMIMMTILACCDILVITLNL